MNNEDLILLRMMDEQYLKTPQYGSHSYATWFQRRESCWDARNIIHDEGAGYYQYGSQPKTGISNKQHKVYISLSA